MCLLINVHQHSYCQSQKIDGIFPLDFENILCLSATRKLKDVF